MPLTRRTTAELEPFDPADTEGNGLDFGILYDEDGEASDQLFISARTKNGETILVALTIEDAFEIVDAIKAVTQLAILARHGQFTRPANIEDLARKAITSKVRES